jgi:ribonuclease-3
MEEILKLKEKLGLEIEPDLLKQAFLHSSYINESKGMDSNERLEFLGDAVIELAVSDYLFKKYDYDEGMLTKIKSVVVSGPVLADKARELELGRCLFLGRGEEEMGGRDKNSILADAFEALVGVIFATKGYKVARGFVLKLLKDEIKKAGKGEGRIDYKSLLQEEAQSRFGCKPIYTLLKEEGADHKKEFTVKVKVANLQGIGRGRKVKEAQQAAAKKVYFNLKRLEV